jgi:hypothetical protein
MSVRKHWPRQPIIIKEPVDIAGLQVGRLRAVLPDDPDYEAHYQDCVRFGGAYPFAFATDEDIADERARRAERVSA